MRINKPAIILVRPQLPENIGLVARVMQNFNLNKLVLVSPREKWPNNKIINVAKHADKIIKNVKIYNNLSKALENYNYIIATTNRKRFLEKNIITSFDEFNDLLISNSKIAILFGPENSGLSNIDLRLANKLFVINSNNSLNLSHAVALVAYKISEFSSFSKKLKSNNIHEIKLSNKKELNTFMDYLINRLEKRNFFNVPSKKQSMINNIYSIFTKVSLTKKEVNTLWGMVKKLGK